MSFDAIKKAFALGMVSLAFPLTLKSMGSVDPAMTSVVLGATVALGNVLSGLAAPGVGALADRRGHASVLPWLGMAVFLGSAGFFALRSTPLAAAAAFAVAFFAYQLTVSVYDAGLTHFSGSRQGRSSTSWAFGFMGSLAVLVLFFATGDDTRPIHPGMIIVVAAAFVLGTMFLSANWPQQGLDTHAASPPPPDFRTVLPVLALYFLIFEGIETLTLFVPLFASSEFEMSFHGLLACLGLMQLVAIPSTLGAGFAATRLGAPLVLACTLLVWTAICVALALVTTATGLVLVFVMTGSVLGSTKALARAWLADVAVPAHAGRLFGFGLAASRGGAILGPLVFAGLTAVTDSSRTSFAVHTSFFVLATLLVVLRYKSPDDT